MKQLYIFDIDGTLALNEHRVHYLENKDDPDRWHKFYSACYKDEPNESVIDVANNLIQHGLNDIYLFTGRREQERDKTINWMIYYATPLGLSIKDNPERLIMRENNDYTKDHILKEHWLHSMLVEDRKRLVGVFDDRKSVVDMYRRNGITVFQVAEGDF